MIVQDVQILRKKSYDIQEYDKILVDKLLDILKNTRGLGISAIQIGVPLKVCIIRTNRNEPAVFWNTTIIEKSIEKINSDEGCLSIPGVYRQIVRHRDIVVKNGDGLKYALSEKEAIILQHEMDHWNGILITDYEIEDCSI